MKCADIMSKNLEWLTEQDTVQRAATVMAVAGIKDDCAEPAVPVRRREGAPDGGLRADTGTRARRSSPADARPAKPTAPPHPYLRQTLARATSAPTPTMSGLVPFHSGFDRLPEAG